MRYLYGDLTEFPRQDNTLDLLQRFVDMAVDVLKLDHEIDKSLNSIKGDREFLTEALDDINNFQHRVQEAVEGTVSGRPEDDLVFILAHGVSENIMHYVEDGKAKVVAKIEQRIQQTEVEIDGFSRQTFGHLRDFFMISGVPISGNTLSCELDMQQYRAKSEILDVTGVQCSYSLDTSASRFFAGPKRFGDLMPGKMEFPVGTRQSRFKKDLVTENMRIDDALLTRVVDREETGEFVLAKNKGNGKEGLLVQVSKEPDGGIKVIRLDEDGSQHEVPESVLSSANLGVLGEFWKQLFEHVVALYRTRAGISAINVDGTEVVRGRLVQNLVARLVSFLAPTIREIDKRSTSREELCLKIDHEGGRREEIYIQKKQLTRRFLELPETLLEAFSPLGIDPSAVIALEDEDVIIEEPGENKPST